MKSSNRLEAMPPYVFSEINKLKNQALNRGMSLLSLAIGDPDRPTPAPIIEKLQQSVARASNHVYSPYEGTIAFRTAVANWFAQRFGVAVDPAHEVVALIGSKEGIAHLPLAFCNPGDAAIYPSPGYPVFQTSLILAGAQAIPLAMRPEHHFRPDPAEVRQLFEKHRPKMMILCFPSNPTSAQCDRATLKQIVDLAREFDVLLAYDNAYSEIYREGAEKPCSILEIEGAKDVAIEFHSFSKTFNMTGWRIGFAVGAAGLVSKLLAVKTFIDSGPLLAVQETAAFALSRADEFATPIRRVYDERLARLLPGLSRLGIEYITPDATFFVWARVPGNEPSMQFTKRLIENEGLVVTPGVGFGNEGEGFFRLALTVDVPKIDQFLERLARQL